MKQVAADINKEVGDGVKVLPVKLDISKPEEVKAFVGNLPDDFKDIDILVNNAGLVKGVDKAPEIKAEDIEIMFSTNVTGLINMTQAIMPIMTKREDGGRGDIINIGSIAGREGYPGGVSDYFTCLTYCLCNVEMAISIQRDTRISYLY